MLILTGSVVDSKTEILCSVCYGVVGLFSQKEIGDMTKVLNAIYCFDCDSVGADSVHPSLYDESGRYFIWFGESCVSVNLWQEVRTKDEIIKIKDRTIGEFLDYLSGARGGAQS